MRALILIVMIALLPVRMWAAEGMSVRMAAQATASMSMDQTEAMDDMSSDCPMRAAAEKVRKDGSKSSVAACAACHLCAAVDVSPEFAPVSEPSRALRAILASSAFDSADPARENKPPIS